MEIRGWLGIRETKCNLSYLMKLHGMANTFMNSGVEDIFCEDVLWMVFHISICFVGTEQC